VNPVRHTLALGNSCADTVAAAALGFALGVAVDPARFASLRWLVWALTGH